MTKLGVLLVVATVAGGAPAPPQSAQPPSAIQEVNDRFVREWSERLGDRVTQPAGQVFKNITLEWLKTVPAGTLLNIMDVGYSKALGVRCTDCHAADDFASDAKRPKQAAREMAIMHRDINQRLAKMKNLTDAAEDRLITCATCHQGSTKPINRTR